MPKFTPRQRKHKIKKKEKQPTVTPQDTNVTELLPVSKTEKEERRQKLKEELRAQQPKVSSKKQKRLDKYIENKLKKEENLALLKKLAQAKIDTSQLQSARHLGVPKNEQFGDGVNLRKRDRSEDISDEASSDSDSDGETRLGNIKNGGPSGKKPDVAIGSGLKRPLEVGKDGFPVLKKRKRAQKPKPVVEEEVPWEGFDSEGSLGSEDDESDSEGGKQLGSDAGLEEDSESEAESMSSEDDDGSGSDDESGDSSEGSADDRPSLKPRASSFKAWAVQQINEAAGFKPTSEAPEELPYPPQPQVAAVDEKCRSFVEEEETLPLELQVTKGDPNRKAFAVRVDRSEEVQNARVQLPVVGEEQKIMEAIHNNPSVVIWGATGSGKTTQLPQFLFEAGYGNPQSPNPGMIAVTQPRRVAAVSMAKRVGDELGQYGSQVSYQIRFDSTVSNKTAIKFMTDGILLREIAQDFSLSKYSIIIIDEAHERSTNTDILIGMASRIVDLRKTMSEEDPTVKPLKLVIMSATLRISDFMQNSNLFRNGAPPLVQAEGRQYPVTVHFSRRTHRDYVEEAFRKVSRGHRKLPHGGFLVFLTGQGEIKDLEKRLKQAFKPTQRQSTQGKVQLSASEAPLETEDVDLGTPAGEAEDDYDNDEDSDIEITGLDDGEDDEFDPEDGSMASSTQVHVVPLYSQLPTKEQLKVFETPPEGSRLIVLATNVAETSLTIPGIKYVFDCGRSKEKQYDLRTGVQTFQIGWISKASASQRAGRAGRTGPGHCYRLYSSAVYERDFSEYTDPEILRTPIEGVVLQMKSMGLHHVINFPFPTPPSQVGLVKAEKLLKNLGALSLDGQISELGKCLSIYPLSPRFGKMLQIGNAHKCIEYVITLVAALTVADLFIPENQLDVAALSREDDQVYTNADRLEDTAREKRRKDYNRAMRIFSKHDEASDALKSLAAVCAYAYAPDGDSFCEQMFLRSRALKETLQLRQQLTHIVRANNPGLLGEFRARLPEPSDKQIRALKQIVTAGFIDQVAIRADLAPLPPDIARKPKRAIDVPYLTLFPSLDGRATELDEKAVYVHPTSILAQLSPKELPQYITYSHLQRAAASSIAGDKLPKVRMHALTAPSGLHLSALAHGTPLIEYGKPIGKVESLGGKPEKRECWVIPSLVGERGSTGWPLPAKKVVQRKDAKEGWVIEKFL
ncbi:putative ATP-dependent RNA helicase DHR1 [Arachnomyces sp. PD_36]|nr:putative ATP-dependent RNA helicase DHR1 [Arachnomyces sp. PD_36]